VDTFAIFLVSQDIKNKALLNRMSLGAGVKIYRVLRLTRSIDLNKARRVFVGCRYALSLATTLVKKGGIK
jgi:hypothetical protein